MPPLFFMRRPFPAFGAGADARRGAVRQLLSRAGLSAGPAAMPYGFVRARSCRPKPFARPRPALCLADRSVRPAESSFFMKNNLSAYFPAGQNTLNCTRNALRSGARGIDNIRQTNKKTDKKQVRGEIIMKVFFVRKKTLTAVLTAAILLVVAVTAGAIALGGAKQSFGKSRELPIYSVETEDKKIAISFDCAWGVDYTDRLLEIMEDKGVVCTFFCVEFWTEKYPEYVKKISDAGHDIGTHSATHPYMSKLDKQTVIKELTTSSEAIEKITGKEVKVFRPPYGDYNDNLISTARELGLYTIQWDVDSLDWKNLSAKEIYNRVVPKVQNGSIVLFHNNGLHTADALGDIIDALLKDGYEFVTIYDLIYKDNFVMDANGRQQLVK